jgi:cardiolipin synthase A/B
MYFSKGLIAAWMSCWRFGLLMACLAGLSGCTNFYGRGIQYQIEHHYSVSDAQFLRTMSSLLEPTLLASNKVTALLNGDQIFPAMLQAVQGARRSICLETYIYWSGEIGETFATRWRSGR